jgi:NAD-dependent DNA ligase
LKVVESLLKLGRDDRSTSIIDGLLNEIEVINVLFKESNNIININNIDDDDNNDSNDTEIKQTYIESISNDNDYIKDSTTNILINENIAISGTNPNYSRNEINELIYTYGGQTSSTLKKSVTILIIASNDYNNDNDDKVIKKTVKIKQAEKLGIQIMNFNHFKNKYIIK